MARRRMIAAPGRARGTNRGSADSISVSLTSEGKMMNPMSVPGAVFAALTAVTLSAASGLALAQQDIATPEDAAQNQETMSEQQDSATGSEAAAALDPQAREKVITEQSEDQKLSADLIGSNVMHPEHGRIGSLDSLLFDDQDKIAGGVISVGGFLGIGAKSVALSWDAFDVRPDENAVYVTLTPEQLESAPSFRDLATVEAERELERQRRLAEQQQQSSQPSY
jgi:hypothetical protein